MVCRLKWWSMLILCPGRRSAMQLQSIWVQGDPSPQNALRPSGHKDVRPNRPHKTFHRNRGNSPRGRRNKAARNAERDIEPHLGTRKPSTAIFVIVNTESKE